MDLTFEQQVIVAIIGGVVASVLTSILNNWWTDRRLRDQWDREKQERLEQWRRQDEARKREWKRQHRKEMLYPFLEKVDKLVGTASFFAVSCRIELRSAEELPSELLTKTYTEVHDKFLQLNEEISLTRALSVGDDVFRKLESQFRQAVAAYISYCLRIIEAEEIPDAVMRYYEQMEATARKLHERAEELLEETFDQLWSKAYISE